MEDTPRPLPGLEALDLDGRAVLCRLDLNVPIAGGEVRSDARLRAALPTLRRLMSSGARVAVASHLGRPQGRYTAEASMQPVATRLGELLGLDVMFAHDCVGDGVRALVQQLQPGQVACLENLRFHKGEEANDAAFARALGRPFAVYVNDAFGTSHRNHASITRVVGSIEACAAGPLMHAEVEGLGQLLKSPPRPFAAVVGGAKVADKLGVLRALVPKVDTLLLGGAMAYTFLHARGVSVGRSRVEPALLGQARELMQRAEHRGCEVLLPHDHVAAADFSAKAVPVPVAVQGIGERLVGLDIGPATAARYAVKMRAAGAVFWNGPLGVAEWPNFAHGSETVARAVADSPGYTVVGGGDSLAVLDALALAGQVDHVSTGGGASLAFLQHGTLPGLEALRRRG